MKKLCLVLLVVLLVLCSACSNASVKNAGEELKDSVAGAMDSNNKYVQMVKSGYRENNPALTYDKAFSVFFETPRWKYFKGNEGKNIVEFTGDCTYQDVAVKERKQFVVDEKQGTFEATYLAFNEVPQNKLILASLIEKVFMPETKQATAKMLTQNKESILTVDEAKKRIQTWIDNHKFSSSSVSIKNGNGNTSKLGGEEYQVFRLQGLKGTADVFVNLKTGEMLIEYGLSGDVESLEAWYTRMHFE